jgi:lipopolysaccharide export LptBFGC system permease protein LptF
MYLKKNATVLISTVIILSLMSMLGFFMFKMMKNNNELSNLYKFNKDIYDLDKSEEEILNKFMKELNKNSEEKFNNSDEESSEEVIELFPEDFTMKIEDNILEYHKDTDKLFLNTNKENGINRKRDIIYSLKDEKIILVPTYKFQDNNE